MTHPTNASSVKDYVTWAIIDAGNQANIIRGDPAGPTLQLACFHATYFPLRMIAGRAGIFMRHLEEYMFTKDGLYS